MKSPCLLVAALAVMALATGCSQEKMRKAAFQAQLTSVCSEISDGDLAQAKDHLEEAKETARGTKEKQKVQSLHQLIAGAEAFMDGNGPQARSEWSQASDPLLRQEIRSQAREVGIDVPLIPVSGSQGGIQ